ncbi:hypothetical protein AWC38_SpisGene11335 [Stylophora pistillata]|uniref:Glycosyltransferase family 92 protein n=1 Tax=Stylophora pistillata TaxID=50429 RepID=A0A2B4S3S9_STYPI|nr:hypothetical protein AWC38_SpisGene11335 [Stylophora pistillata]
MHMFFRPITERSKAKLIISRIAFGPQMESTNTQRLQEKRQLKMETTQSSYNQESNSEEENDDLGAFAADDFFPPQKSHDERCSRIRGEKLQFDEIVEGSFIYSAFLDYRFKDQTFIRMISIFPSYSEPPQMYCHFMDLRTEEYFTSVVEIEELGTNDGFTFQGYLSSCDLPEEIDSYTLCSVNVSLEPESFRQTDENTKQIPLHVSEDQPMDTETYALCIPPISGEISAGRLVEFLELSEILGVSYFVFYDANLSDKTLKVLQYYNEIGAVTLNPWPLPQNIASNIQDGGQTVALNDCLYRNIDRFKYVAFNKLDEFIVPLQSKKTLDIFESQSDEDTAGICFQGFIFDTSTFEEKRSHTLLFTQRFTSRIKSPTEELARCIVSPKYVFSLELNAISNPLETFYTTHHVDTSFGHVFRYGECNYAECKDSLQDLTMAKYREELEKRLNLTMIYLRQYQVV